jgi:DNA-binding transcriptional ArsR family regulator
MSVPAYVAAMASKTEAYLIEDGKKKDLPILPIIQFGKEKREVLLALRDGTISLTQLSEKLNPGKNKPSEKSRLGYHLADLTRGGFIAAKNKSKNRLVELSSLGKIYVKTL